MNESMIQTSGRRDFCLDCIRAPATPPISSRYTPDLYEVQLDVDGLMIADPGNSMAKPQRVHSSGPVFRPSAFSVQAF
jgi:hypothetical protein